MTDKTMKCVENTCGKEFVLTAGEQEFYAKKRDENGQPFNPPKRCPDCRFKRKQERQQQEVQKEIKSYSPFNEAKEALKNRHNDRNRRS